MTNNQHNRTAWAFAVLVVGLLLVMMGLLLAPKGEAAQPYGGCDEAWQAPHSTGADECRALGWTVKRSLVLDPTNRVRALMGVAPCVSEDQETQCFWKATCRGNGRGDSFVVLNGRHWYVSFGHPCLMGQSDQAEQDRWRDLFDSMRAVTPHCRAPQVTNCHYSDSVSISTRWGQVFAEVHDGRYRVTVFPR